MRNGKGPDGRQVRWQEHNQLRRRAIIDATIAVIERQAPGEDVQVQAVADEAGLSRTVIYRHFTDRADLDRAVQRVLCEEMGTFLMPALAHDGRPDEIVHRVIEAFVVWAVEHPSLFWFSDRDLAGWGPSPIVDAMEQIAEGISGIVNVVVDYLGVELSADDRAGLDPWLFGMIGAVFTAVRRWLGRPEQQPATPQFVDMLSESIWCLVNGMATSRGLNLPDLPITALLQPLSGAEA